MARDIVNVLLSRIKVNAAGCFEWQGCLNHSGYGMLNVNGVPKGAHRLSFEAFRRCIPTGMFVCHKCDNPRCINPSHLFLGSHADNMQDMRSKRRSSTGSKNGMSKVTTEDVIEMTRLYMSGVTQRELSGKYGISRQAVSKIVTGKRWGSVQRERATPQRATDGRVSYNRNKNKLLNQ